MAHNIPQNHTAARRARLVQSLLALTLATGSLHAANIDTYWTDAAGDGNWSTAGNWSNGVPFDRSPTDVGRVFFTTTLGGATSGLENNVTLAGSTVINALYVGNSSQKTVNLSLLDGVTMNNTGTIVVGGSATAPAHLTVNGPATGSATFNFGGVGGLQLAGAKTGSGSTVTFTGAGLQVTDVSSLATIGRLGNGHTLTVAGGASYTGKGMVISGTVNEDGGVGLNHRLVVTGADSSVTLKGQTGAGSTLALIVGSRPLYIGTATSGTASSMVTSGNAVSVSDGGKLSVIGDNPDATVSVLVGAATYRQNNSITVTGAGSVLEVSGRVATTIGHASTTTYNNRVVVDGGGVFQTDAIFTINNGSSIAANRRNILRVGDGGTFASSSVVNNNGGLVSLAEGGSLLGRNLTGAAAPLVVNINGTGRFEAAGTGLGNGVTVNVGSVSTSQAVFAVGLPGHTSPASLTVNSALNFNDGSLLEVTHFDNGIGSIFLGTDASVTIGANVGFSLVSASATSLAPGSYQLFTGTTGSIVGSFAADRVTLPSLAEGLTWDLSGFNSAGNWTLTVASPIPEPASAAFLLGLGSVLGTALRRRRRA